jgi:hypothetical protein
MATRVVVGIVALVCVSICGMIATFTIFEMVGKVNDKLPKGEQFAALGWYLSRYQRLQREYKSLYPDGRLLLKLRVLRALMIACLLICVWSFGFFAK